MSNNRLGFQSKLLRLIILLIKTSPGLTSVSIFAKAAFLLSQLASILLIFSWINGSVPAMLVNLVGLPKASNGYAFIGAAGLISSSVLALLSKKYALQAILQVEKKILSEMSFSGVKVNKGDLKNMVKVLLSVTDVIVPIMLMLAVVIAWSIVTPYSMFAIAVLAVLALLLMKKGVSFSAKRYQPSKIRTQLSEYFGSDEHRSFYRILIMPNYIGVAMLSLIAGGIIFSVLAARVYLDGHETYAHILIIATAVSFLQARSFVGIILRTGAYNRSLGKVVDVLGPAHGGR